MAERPYSRVYWSVMDDAKFDGIREDVRHFGSWTLLLIVAEMAHPAPAFVPPTVPKASIRALATCGLIDLLEGGRYRVHGLASEREMRAEWGRIGAAVRWHSNGNAEPMLAKQSIDKTKTSQGLSVENSARAAESRGKR